MVPDLISQGFRRLMMAERRWRVVELGGVPTPAGAYTPVVRAGDWLFVSRQVPTDPATGQVVGDTVAHQTSYVIEKLARALAGAGATLADVVAVNAYLTDMSRWDEFNAAYRAGFDPPYPTRTTVGAQLHGVLVELSAVAYAPGG